MKHSASLLFLTTAIVLASLSVVHALPPRISRSIRIPSRSMGMSSESTPGQELKQELGESRSFNATEALERLRSMSVPEVSVAGLGSGPDPPHIVTTHYIKAQDGTKLHTLVYFPIGVGSRTTVLIRTPYNAASGQFKTQCLGLVQQGFNCASQDFRGMFKSSGTFSFWLKGGSDAYDTMEWIKKQAWSNGVVVTTGASANAIASYVEPLEAPSALQMQWVLAGSANVHATTFQGGAFRNSLMSDWLLAVQQPWFLLILKKAEAYSDFWATGNMDSHYGNVDFPAIHVMGWYDIFSQFQLDAYDGYNLKGGPHGKGNQYLFALPSGHCQGGEFGAWPKMNDGLSTSMTLRETLYKAAGNTTKMAFVEKRFREEAVPRVSWYTMGPFLNGSQGNFWNTGSALPTPTPTKYYMFADGGLNTTAPTATNSTTTYTFDPTSPVGTVGGNNLFIPCGPRDQRSLENRTDIVKFISVNLTTTMTITGRLTVTVSVSSSAVDTDFTAKLIDVFPDGTSYMVQDGIIRMRWRDSNTTPKMMTPGTVYTVDIDLWTTSYVFNVGHAIRVDISSSNYPRFDVNPNTGQPLSNPGTPVSAQNSIHFTSSNPSYITLPVVSTTPPTEGGLDGSDIQAVRDKILQISSELDQL